MHEHQLRNYTKNTYDALGIVLIGKTGLIRAIRVIIFILSMLVKLQILTQEVFKIQGP
jgi:hypothetical protein